MIVQEIEVDHGLQVPMELFFGKPDAAWPVKVVPIFVNVIQFPIPLPSRCYELGRCCAPRHRELPGGRAGGGDRHGGLSHQLQGARAGFTNPELTANSCAISRQSGPPRRAQPRGLRAPVRQRGCGADDVAVMRGAMDPDVVVKHSHYFVPASMTGAGMLVLENKAA